MNLDHDETTWVLDNGPSVHVTSQRDIFTSYTPGNFGDMMTADQGVVECIGLGEIFLESSNGSKMVLKDVKHIPSVRLNLISGGKLCGEKYDILFSGDTWKLKKGAMVLARGKQHFNLYLTCAKVIRDSVNAVESNDRIIESDDKTELWHMRLSHISEKGLDCLAKKNVLHGVKRAKLEKCAHCFAGKQRRVSFSSRPSRKLDFLQLVHFDIRGPLKAWSLGGAQYFVTFIDDYSRKFWVYTLNKKEQVLDVFKQF